MSISVPHYFLRALHSRTPWFFFTASACSIFSAEVLVMFLFMTLPPIPEVFEAFLDGVLLSILVSPALYHFLYKPLNIENRERRIVEKELRHSKKLLELQANQLQEYNQELEQKVAERTQELNIRNHELQGLLEELHSMQAHIVQTEKMSSLGQLVAGIAHEINNPIGFIYGNIEHIESYTQDTLKLLKAYQAEFPNPPESIQTLSNDIDLDFISHDLEKILRSIAIGSERIQQIVLSLRNFSRLGETGFKATDIHEGIENTLMILQHRLKPTSENPGIQINKDYGNLPLIECAPEQLNQVFMNLLINSIDAIEEAIQKTRPNKSLSQVYTIWISTQVIEEKRVKIEIIDNGAGVSEEAKTKIFDPFFTTKPVGEGTGLGLSISYKIITETHQGSIQCDSQDGDVTRFSIEIPIRQPMQP